jgi:uncharacterized membrane protein YbhN (UPF0104 family)
MALGWLIAGLVVAAIGITLRDSLPAAGDALAGTPPLGLAALMLPGALMMLFSGLSFSLLVLPGNSNFARRGSIVGIYLTAQVIKYLPGRVWGLVYQLKRLSEQVHGSQGLMASLNHLMLTALMSVLFLGVALDVPGAWPIIFSGTLLGLLWVQRGGVAAYLGWMKKIPATTLAKLPVKTVMGIGISVSLEWVFYLAVWAGLFMLLRMPPEPEPIISVAALYAGAWILGSLTSLLPGGIGVREGGFIVMGLGLRIPEPELVALALLARLTFTLAETLTGALAAAYLHRTAAPR